MINVQKIIYTCFLIFTILIGINSAQAALVNYTITGDVILGDRPSGWNAFGLTAGDTITATGIFDDSVLTSGSGTILFDSASGNSMTLTVGSQTFTASDDDRFLSGSPSITLDGFGLLGFDYLASTSEYFSSYLTGFDDGDSLYGEWQTTVAISPVPVPAALWLFGSGLIGLIGISRRRQSV